MKDMIPSYYAGAIAQFLSEIDPVFKKLLLLTTELVIWGDYIVALTVSEDMRDALINEKRGLAPIAHRLGYKFTAAVLPTELRHWKKAKRWRKTGKLPRQ